MHRALLALCLLCIAGMAPAQEVRFELGQRLRLLEQALDRHPSIEARKRGLEPLVQATPTFFSGRLGDAAGLLDRARLALPGKETPSDTVVWAESLVVRPTTRFQDASAKELPIKVESFYRVTVKAPEKVQLRYALVLGDGKAIHSHNVAVPMIPTNVTFPLADGRDGDYQLRSEILVAGQVCAVAEQTVSFASKMTARLEALQSALASLPKSPRTTESATLARLVGILADLAEKKTLETNYPAARLLSEAEAVLKAIRAEKRYYVPERAGQFWVTLASDKGSDAVRIQVPPNLGKRVPLVVAMHGAGGSENMFFDGYGDGLVAKLCAKRGWLLVTTRSPLLSFGGPDVARVIDTMADLYPVDKQNIFLVGHSMGAAQAVAFAGRQPERVCAVAALGGGGGIKESDYLKTLPFFVGVGDRDFALGGARNLHRRLTQVGVKKAVLKVYDDVEHLLIVQLALPEVFAFFDESRRKTE